MSEREQVEAAKKKALTIPCPKCGMGAGVWCYFGKNLGIIDGGLHLRRYINGDAASRLPAPVSQPVPQEEQVTPGSGNVFADLGLPEAEDLQRKARKMFSQAEPSESAGDDGLQQRVDAAWAKYRSSVHGDFDVYARMHFASGYRAASQPSTLPQSSLQTNVTINDAFKAAREWWEDEGKSLTDNYERLATRGFVAGASWSLRAAQAQPVAEIPQLVSELEHIQSQVNSRSGWNYYGNYLGRGIVISEDQVTRINNALQQYRQRFGKKERG